MSDDYEMRRQAEDRARARVAYAGGELDTFLADWKVRHKLTFAELAVLLADRITIDGSYIAPSTMGVRYNR